MCLFEVTRAVQRVGGIRRGCRNTTVAAISGDTLGGSGLFRASGMGCFVEYVLTNVFLALNASVTIVITRGTRRVLPNDKGFFCSFVFT